MTSLIFDLFCRKGLGNSVKTNLLLSSSNSSDILWQISNRTLCSLCWVAAWVARDGDQKWDSRNLEQTCICASEQTRGQWPNRPVAKRAKRTCLSLTVLPISTLQPQNTYYKTMCHSGDPWGHSSSLQKNLWASHWKCMNSTTTCHYSYNCCQLSSLDLPSFAAGKKP